MVTKAPVVLVNIQAPFRVRKLESRAPLACMYLSRMLKDNGFAVHLENIQPQEMQDSVARAAEIRPLFIGVTATFGCWTNHFLDYSNLFKARCPGVPVLWGGVFASSVPDLVLKEDSVDYVCLGEGEDFIVEFAGALAGTGKLERIDNLAYRASGGKLTLNPMRPLEKNIDRFEYDWSLINPADYVVEKLPGVRVFSSYQGSRGCPYNCAFCYNSQFNNRRYRPHSLEFVLKDLDMLKEAGANYIEFIDDHFFANPRRAMTLLEEMHRRGTGIFNPDLRAKDVTDDNVRKFQKLKMVWPFFGTESENPRILKLIRKEISPEDITNAFEVFNRYRMTNATQFMLGVPTHTREETRATAAYAAEVIDKYPLTAVNLVPYAPLPGTSMFQDCIRDGYNPPSSVREYSSFGITADRVGFGNMEWLKGFTRREKQHLRRCIRHTDYLMQLRGVINSPATGKRSRRIYRFFYRRALRRMTADFYRRAWDMAAFSLFRMAKRTYVRMRALLRLNRRGKNE